MQEGLLTELTSLNPELEIDKQAEEHPDEELNPRRRRRKESLSQAASRSKEGDIGHKRDLEGAMDLWLGVAKDQYAKAHDRKGDQHGERDQLS